LIGQFLIGQFLIGQFLIGQRRSRGVASLPVLSGARDKAA